MDELLKRIEAETLPSETDFLNILDKEAQPEMRQPATPNVEKALPGAIRIYKALKNLVIDYRLDGFTLRCFDLLGSIHNTGCLALALLNAEGIVAGCEGDVPAMISMAITNALIGKTGFQANPARIDTSNGEMWFAHCTIPLNMVQKISLDTHFESGIGVGICGSVEKGPITIFKTDADGERFFAEEGMLNACPSKADLCRTQMVISLSRKENTSYFLTNPIGNHHIIVAGHHKNLYEEMMMG